MIDPQAASGRPRGDRPTRTGLRGPSALRAAGHPGAARGRRARGAGLRGRRPVRPQAGGARSGAERVGPHPAASRPGPAVEGPRGVPGPVRLVLRRRHRAAGRRAGSPPVRRRPGELAAGRPRLRRRGSPAARRSGAPGPAGVHAGVLRHEVRDVVRAPRGAAHRGPRAEQHPVRGRRDHADGAAAGAVRRPGRRAREGPSRHGRCGRTRVPAALRPRCRVPRASS